MTTAFVEKATHAARVTKQDFVYGKDDVPTLILSAQLIGQLANDRKPEAGHLPCPQVEVEVRMTFPHDQEDKLKYAMNDLERLGFTDDDLELLNPANKKHRSFIGETIYVAPKTSVYNDREQTFWNLRSPKDFNQKPVEPGTMKKSKANAAFKELMARKKNAATDSQAVPF